MFDPHALFEKELAELRAIVEPLNELRREEDSTILIPCDGPEGCIITVKARWTDWPIQPFEGGDLADALAYAVAAKRKAEADDADD